MPHNCAIDIAVGRRLRIKRIQERISAQEIAARLNMPIELVKAFEAGRIRIGADHLFAVARILRVAPRFFLEDISRDARQIAALRAEATASRSEASRKQPA